MLKHAMNKQKGMTAISWIIMVAFIGFNGLVAINVAPVYFTDSSVASLWETLENDAMVVGESPKNLRKLIIKRLKINNVYGVKKDDIKIKKSKGFYIVTYGYEPRGKIVGSLDFIITFKHEAKIRVK